MIVEQKHARQFIKISFLSMVPTCLSYYYGIYDIMVMIIIVFLTSINYWRHPIYGWRRNMDISAVVSGVFYQFYRNQDCNHKLSVYSMIGVGTCSYLSSCYYYNKRRYLSIILHCGVHISANIALVFLITGL